jgi:hypothetical protein
MRPSNGATSAIQDSKCRKRGRISSPAIAERNKRIAAEYEAGETAKAIGERYGLSRRSIVTIARKMGIPSDPSRGYRQQRKTYARNPELAERHKRRAAEALAVYAPQPRTWPTCPAEKRQDFDTLRKYYGAQAAREILEGGA